MIIMRFIQNQPDIYGEDIVSHDAQLFLTELNTKIKYHDQFAHIFIIVLYYLRHGVNFLLATIHYIS